MSSTQTELKHQRQHQHHQSTSRFTPADEAIIHTISSTFDSHTSDAHIARELALHHIEHQCDQFALTKDKGDHWERFTLAFLKCCTKQAWLLRDLPADLRQQLGLQQQDKGIDAVFLDHEGKYGVAQAKYRNKKQNILPWNDANSFWSLSQFTGPAGETWRHRMLITNCDKADPPGDRRPSGVIIANRGWILNELWRMRWREIATGRSTLPLGMDVQARVEQVWNPTNILTPHPQALAAEEKFQPVETWWREVLAGDGKSLPFGQIVTMNVLYDAFVKSRRPQRVMAQAQFATALRTSCVPALSKSTTHRWGALPESVRVAHQALLRDAARVEARKEGCAIDADVPALALDDRLQAVRLPELDACRTSFGELTGVPVVVVREMTDEKNAYRRPPQVRPPTLNPVDVMVERKEPSNIVTDSVQHMHHQPNANLWAPQDHDHDVEMEWVAPFAPPQHKSREEKPVHSTPTAQDTTMHWTAPFAAAPTENNRDVAARMTQALLEWYFSVEGKTRFRPTLALNVAELMEDEAYVPSQKQVEGLKNQHTAFVLKQKTGQPRPNKKRKAKNGPK